jgi:hypothetical protein
MSRTLDGSPTTLGNTQTALTGSGKKIDRIPVSIHFMAQLPILEDDPSADEQVIGRKGWKVQTMLSKS